MALKSTVACLAAMFAASVSWAAPEGYRLVSVATNEAHSFEMPSGAVVVGNWHRRGAFRDWLRLDMGGFAFPLGTNECTSFSVFVDGRIRPRPRDREREICAVGTPMLAMQGASRLWFCAENDGSRTLTWENFFLDADTNAPVSAQIRLWPDGSFATRSNAVECAYARVHPADLDGDGIPNARDSAPLSWDGDFHGPRDETPPDARLSAYCTVDIVVTTPFVAEVLFEGDGESNLPDPHFMARGGVTNTATILVGKTYEVGSDAPIRCVGVSDAATVVVTNCEHSLTICRPVTVTCGEASAVRGSAGAAFTVDVDPPGLGGEIRWGSGTCCEVVGGEAGFSYACGGSCGCGGCRAPGLYVYEGYGLAFLAPPCPCEPEGHGHGGEEQEQPASVAVSFSEDAYFYEDAYTNSPGDVALRRVSTNAVLTCSAYGGPNGGVLRLDTANLSRLARVGGDALPSGPVDVAPFSSVSWRAEYEPVAHSERENDIAATATFCENVSGETLASTAKTTVVKLTLEPWEAKPGFENRHVVGVCEKIFCKAEPDIGQWGEIGGGEFLGTRGSVDYKCPLTSDGSVLYCSVDASRHYFNLTIVEPSAMVARLPVARDFGIPENHAGGAGMNLQVYVLPDTVAFSGIAMEEIPSSSGTHQGYFSNLYFTNVWYHTVAMGAGRWTNIKPDNYWETDRAWMGDELPHEMPSGHMTYDMSDGSWSDGSLVWDITWGWAERDSTLGDIPVSSIPTKYNQSFAIDREGTLAVSKFQNAVSRGTNNVIRLNGDVVQGIPLTEEEINATDGND